METEKKLPEAQKPDVVLSGGKAIFFDLDAISYGDVLGMADPLETKVRTDETIGKSAGMTLEEVKTLTGRDFKMLVRAFWQKWRDPISDPND